MISRRLAAWLGAAIVVIAFGLPLFVDLGATDFKGDEPIYAFAIDRILDQGDWLTPKSIPGDQTPFLEKPPLKFWIVAASVRAHLLPQNEFGYRVWDVLFGIAAFLYVYAIGLRISGIVCGLTAVLVLFGHQPLVLEHGLRSNNMEAALVLSYCAGVYHALAWFDASTERRRLHAMLVGLWFTFGFMVKFVAAAFLPASIVAVAIVSRRWRTRIIGDWRLWTAVAFVNLALILPWFIYQFRLRGEQVWTIMFGEHIVERFTASLDPSHLHPWYFYLTTMAREFSWAHDLVLVCAGLTLLAYQAIWQRRDWALLLLAWFVIPLIAISTGTSKLYHYVYPFLPPLALGVGLVAATVLAAARRYDSEVSRLLDRIWPARWSAAIPGWLRVTLSVAAVIAITLAVLTPIIGSVWIRAGGVILIRNSTVSRPLIAATVLFVVLGLFRILPLALVTVLLLVALPLDAYRNVKSLEASQARYEDAPMRTLRDCLLQVQASGSPRGVYLHTADDVGQWKFVYYLRRPGWSTDEVGDQRMLEQRLLTPDAERPVLMKRSDFDAFRRAVATDPPRDGSLSELDRIRRITWDIGWIMLLPGPYAQCADVKGGSVSTSQ